MADSAASMDVLKLIHGLVAKDMQQRLEQAIEGEAPLTATEWGAITRFLKDNGVEPEMGVKNPLDGLLDDLENFDERGNIIQLNTNP
jgi:hypothetical protein